MRGKTNYGLDNRHAMDFQPQLLQLLSFLVYFCVAVPELHFKVHIKRALLTRTITVHCLVFSVYVC